MLGDLRRASAHARCPRQSWRRLHRADRAAALRAITAEPTTPLPAAPPAPAELAPLLAAASAAVHRSAALCASVRAAFDASCAAGSSVSKLDDTPVTVADFAVQALLSLELGRQFPDIPMVAEEDSATLRASPQLLAQVVRAVAAAAPSTSPPPTPDAVLAAIDRGVAPLPAAAMRRWVLDPIDGTKGFLKGGDAQYAIGLALMDARPNAPPLLGIMALPNWQLHPASKDCRGVVLAAARGGGAWVRPLGLQPDAPWQPARVDPAAGGQLSAATVCISDHEAWETVPMAAAAAPEVPRAVMRLCCGSLVKYAAVALGAASLFVQHPVPGVHRLKVWDHAAGVACVLEAGGAVADFSGRDLALGGGREFVPAGLGCLVCAAGMRQRALALLPEPGAWPLLVLLDRDGTINQDLGTWVMSADDMVLIPGAAQAIAALNGAGHTVAVVTNQSCVGRGLIDAACLEGINDAMRGQLGAEAGARIDALFFAADDPSTGVAATPRRKPGPGMLQEAMDLYGVPPERCIMVGDTVNDMAAAEAAGVQRRYLVCTGHGKKLGEAAAAAGLALPVELQPRGGNALLAGAIPAHLMPLQLHADLASVVRDTHVLQPHRAAGPSSPSSSASVMLQRVA